MSPYFFSPDSFWNSPVNAPVDQNSNHYIELLKNEPTGGFHINCNAYSIPVYRVDENTPRYTVSQRIYSPEEAQRFYPKFKDCTNRFRLGPHFGNAVPIPDIAIPAPGTDCHMAIVDEQSQKVWDMWGVARSQEGDWSSNTGMVYDMKGSGIFDPSMFEPIDGDSIHFHGPSRGSGTPAVAGVVLYDEVMAGEINHKLAFACRFNASKKFTYPACWTDGYVQDGLPEGCIIQLDPELDLELFSLTPAEKTICKALQTYGAVSIDNSAGTCLMFEYIGHAQDQKWEDILDPDSLKQIPLEHFRVLEVGECGYGGDHRVPRSLHDYSHD